MRFPDGDTIAQYTFVGSLLSLLVGLVLTGLTVLVGANFSANTPDYCYVNWNPTANSRYDYHVYRHRRFAGDLRMAGAGSAEEAAHYVELLCH